MKIILFITSIPYLILSVGYWNFNPGEWDPFLRVGGIVATIIFLFAGAFAVYSPEREGR